MFDVQFARRQMIEQQVRAWEVLDLKVLDALQQVPREEYVPAALREIAFADTSALEVGTGSGFFAACIGRLARSVRTIDLFPDFVMAASKVFARTGTHNVVAETADAMQLTERDAYDVIALTGSLPVYDARFERALKVGGRLFVTVGNGPMLEALRVTRTGPSDWSRESLFETGMPALLHAPEPSKFVF
jgi:protein-L-isoaspartate(D-aspartate) O-methyltransferase